MKTIFIAAASLLFAASASAQQLECKPAAEGISILSQQYHEAPVAMGVARAGLMHMWASEDGSTWTITLTTPNGIMCLVTAGEGYEPLTPTYTFGDPA